MQPISGFAATFSIFRATFTENAPVIGHRSLLHAQCGFIPSLFT